MSRRWWEQDGIDLEGAKKQAAESMTRSEMDSEEKSDGEPKRVTGEEEESQGARGSSEVEWSGAEEG